MVRTRKELEGHGLPSLQFRCAEAGLDVNGSREELIDRLLESEGQPAGEPAEPEPTTEPEPTGEGTGEGTGEPGEGSEEAGKGTGEPEPEPS